MKIELDNPSAEHYRIEAYADDAITINGERYTSSLIITPLKLVSDWHVDCFSHLATQHISVITDLEPEVIILGTGRRLHFPAPRIIAGVFNNNIGFEVMDSGAACRCYNLLAAEGRRVAAAIIIPATEVPR